MPFNNKSTRTPAGSTNSAPWQTMANCGSQYPTWVHEYFNDFNTYLPSDWTVTLTGTGTSALTAFDGGALLSTTTAGATDANFYQLGAAGFKIGSQVSPVPKETFFKYSGVLSDVVNSTFYAGLIVTSATPLTATDGLYIYKATGSSTMALVSKIGGVTTTVPFPAPCVPVNGVQFEVGIHVDYLGNVEAFWNPTTGDNPLGYAQQAANPPVPLGRVATLYQTGAVPVVTSAVLNLSFGIQNGAAAAKTLTTDFIVAERHR
jgi:hypothetical protein